MNFENRPRVGSSLSGYIVDGAGSPLYLGEYEADTYADLAGDAVMAVPVQDIENGVADEKCVILDPRHTFWEVVQRDANDHVVGRLARWLDEVELEAEVLGFQTPFTGREQRCANRPQHFLELHNSGQVERDVMLDENLGHGYLLG